jgi:hypothetical protein
MELENKIKCVLMDFEINEITLQEATRRILLLLDVVGALDEQLCPRCGSDNIEPSDKENDNECNYCGFIWA